MKIALKDIKPSPRPVRTSWDEEKLDELTRSIDEQGLLVPIKIRPVGTKHEIVYGHRRVEAMRRLEWSETDALVDGIDDTTAMVQALIENIQREDMNSMDKARALKTIMDEKEWNPYDVERAGLMSHSHADLLVRLLNEPTRIQKKVSNSVATGITESHARAARQSGLKPIERVRVIEKAERENLPARATEYVARAIASEPDPVARENLLHSDYREHEQRFEQLATKNNNHKSLDPLMTSDTPEWYTPPHIQFLGEQNIRLAGQYQHHMFEVE